MNSEKLAATATLAVLGGDGQHWCQHAVAVNAVNQQVAPQSPDAVAWSLWGAVRAAKINDESKKSLLSYLNSFAGNRRMTLDSFNDHPDTTFEDVRAMLMKVVQSKHTR